MKNFVKTESKSVRDELRTAGFTELPMQGKFYVFVNDGKLDFSAEEKKEMLFTNKMCM